MLSYRHAYHAGNPADVLKHCTLLVLIQALQLKEAGFIYFDTHAGGGIYNLQSTAAQKNREYTVGVSRLLTWAQTASQKISTTPETSAKSAKSALLAYAALLERFNREQRQLLPPVQTAATGTPLNYSVYPGSPALAQQLLRKQDKLCLSELQAQEYRQLKQYFHHDRRVAVHQRDAYEALGALLPPALKRGLILIDPSYELKDEPQYIVRAIQLALNKFPQGVYAIWYPIIEGVDPIARLRHHECVKSKTVLDIHYLFPLDARLGRMDGCGMFLINPPWHAQATLLELTATLDLVFNTPSIER